MDTLESRLSALSDLSHIYALALAKAKARKHLKLSEIDDVLLHACSRRLHPVKQAIARGWTEGGAWACLRELRLRGLARVWLEGGKKVNSLTPEGITAHLALQACEQEALQSVAGDNARKLVELIEGFLYEAKA